MKKIFKYAAVDFPPPLKMYDSVVKDIESIGSEAILFGLENITHKDGSKKIIEKLKEVIGEEKIDNFLSTLSANRKKRNWNTGYGSKKYYVTFSLPVMLGGWSGLKDLNIEEANNRVASYFDKRFGGIYGVSKSGLPCIKLNFIIIYDKNYQRSEETGARESGSIDPKDLDIDINIYLQDIINNISDSRNKKTIDFNPFIERMKKTLYHELVHFGQIVFKIVHNLEKPGGLPKRNILKEDFDEGVHYVKDIEFQTYIIEATADLRSRLDKISKLNYNNLFLRFINFDKSFKPKPYLHEYLLEGFKYYPKLDDAFGFYNILTPLTVEDRRKFLYMDWFKYIKNNDRERWKLAVQKIIQKLNELGYDVSLMSKEEKEEYIILDLLKIVNLYPEKLINKVNIKSLYNDPTYLDIFNNHPDILEAAFINATNKGITPKVNILDLKEDFSKKDRINKLKELSEKNPKEFLEKNLDNPEASEFLDSAAMNLADKNPKDFLDNQKLVSQFSQYVTLAAHRFYS